MNLANFDVSNTDNNNYVQLCDNVLQADTMMQLYMYNQLQQDYEYDTQIPKANAQITSVDTAHNRQITSSHCSSSSSATLGRIKQQQQQHTESPVIHSGSRTRITNDKVVPQLISKLKNALHRLIF